MIVVSSAFLLRSCSRLLRIISNPARCVWSLLCRRSFSPGIIELVAAESEVRTPRSGERIHYQSSDDLICPPFLPSSHRCFLPKAPPACDLSPPSPCPRPLSPHRLPLPSPPSLPSTPAPALAPPPLPSLAPLLSLTACPCPVPSLPSPPPLALAPPSAGHRPASPPPPPPVQGVAGPLSFQ